MATSQSLRKILVTGANSGIGLALCKQLCIDYGVHVYLGARDLARGAMAVEEVKAAAGPDASIDLIQIDVSSELSVNSAAESLRGCGGLYAIVNNAGTGFAHGTGGEELLNVNIFGAKRVVDAFLPLLSEGSRIVNVGSGAGPSYVSKQSLELQKLLCSPDITWQQLEEILANGLQDDSSGGYGLSKACLASYSMLLARELPHIRTFCLTPGFIDTAIVRGWGATKPPEEGTVSLRHCLFADLPETSSGWFFGSDAVRSPLHFMRNPGEPAFDGQFPWEQQLL